MDCKTLKRIYNIELIEELQYSTENPDDTRVITIALVTQHNVIETIGYEQRIWGRRYL